MISADEAKTIILQQVRPLGHEAVSLGGADHRFLAAPVAAPIPLPPFDNAAMDGHAVRSGDTKGADKNPVSLPVVGTVAAGGDARTRLLTGHAIRIMTGAPLPAGADAVVPFEETCQDPLPLTPSLEGELPRLSGKMSQRDRRGGWGMGEGGSCRILSRVPPGYNIRRTGEDVRQGEELLQAGTPVTPRVVALLAALGINKISVYKKPGVKIVSTGSELVEPGNPLPAGRVYNSNGIALAAALAEIGMEPAAFCQVPDRTRSLEEALRRNLDADVLMTVGGVSAGDFDLVPEVLEKIGAKILFHKVAIKPGKPFLFATLERSEGSGLASPERGGDSPACRGRCPEGTEGAGRGAIGGAAKNTIDASSHLQRRTGPLLIMALPGNPVSSLMVFDRFVRPALLKMIGSKQPERLRRVATAVDELKGSDGKEDFLRGIVEYRDGRYVARSAGSQGSARLLSLARANATLILPASQKKVSAGDPVVFESWGEG